MGRRAKDRRLRSTADESRRTGRAFAGCESKSKRRRAHRALAVVVSTCDRAAAARGRHRRRGEPSHGRGPAARPHRQRRCRCGRCGTARYQERPCQPRDDRRRGEARTPACSQGIPRARVGDCSFASEPMAPTSLRSPLTERSGFTASLDAIPPVRVTIRRRARLAESGRGFSTLEDVAKSKLSGAASWLARTLVRRG